MRYAIISKGLDLDQLEAEVKKAGGTNVKVARVLKQVFCELNEASVSQLSSIPGLAVKHLEHIKVLDVAGRDIPLSGELGPLEVPVYAASRVLLSSEMYDLRTVLTPPITGAYTTICILDSGIRHTHETLRDKVIYEANFSNAPTCEDIYDHGTGIAYCAVGGRHSAGEESGVAPGAKLWNLKVLDDDGIGDEENAIMAIEFCVERRLAAMEAGISSIEPEFPNQINLSWGKEDTGDPDSPLRLACQAAMDAGFGVYAAVGNEGPGAGSIMEPATDPVVIAVGALTFSPFEIWQYSGRGPTLEGYVKPDFVFFGVRILVASSRADDAFVIKSGTSFSTPYVNGLGALAVELLIRTFGETGPTVDPVPEIMRQMNEAWEMYAPVGYAITSKPEGYSAADKDNIYGFGLPVGSLIAQAFGAGAADITGIVGTVVPLMGLGMVGMMMSGMTKGMKE